jgi:hypothetical protein
MPIRAIFEGTPSVMNDTMPLLPGLLLVLNKPLVARFDGGHLSSDAGVLVLREIEQRPGIAGRLAGCIADPRDQTQILHTVTGLIQFRMLMIASGYEDGNDASFGPPASFYHISAGVPMPPNEPVPVNRKLHLN